VDDAIAGELEALIRGYIDHWNASDAEAVWTRFYRLGPDAAIKGVGDVQKHMDGLLAQGFDHSEVLSIAPEVHGPDSATVRIRFTRWTTAGDFMPPRDRGAEYQARRFDDGWRITSVLATA
jgi:hypothetical protein